MSKLTMEQEESGGRGMSGLWRVVVTGPSGAEEWGSAEAPVDRAQELMEACARCMRAKVVKLPYALYGAPWDDVAPAKPARPQAFLALGRGMREVMDAAEAETYMQWLERLALEDKAALASLRDEMRRNLLRQPIYCANVDDVPSLSLQAHEIGEAVTQEVVVAMWRSLKEKYEALNAVAGSSAQLRPPIYASAEQPPRLSLRRQGDEALTQEQVVAVYDLVRARLEELESEARALREEDQRHRARGSSEKRLVQALANSEAARASMAVEIGELRRQVRHLAANGLVPRRYPHRGGGGFGTRYGELFGAPYGRHAEEEARPVMAFMLAVTRPEGCLLTREVVAEVACAVDEALGRFVDVVMLEHMPELDEDEDLHAVFAQEENVFAQEEEEEDLHAVLSQKEELEERGERGEDE